MVTSTNRQLFLILSVLVVLGVVVFAFNLFKPFNLGFISGNEKEATTKVERLYELTNPGIDVTIEKVEEVSGVYKVLFKAVDVSGAVTYRETYVTKDGNLLSENMILVAQSIDQINRSQNFVDCLASKQVRVYGLANQTATILQFNILGGAYATKLYNSCDGEFAQQCVDAGITQVPSVVYNNQVYPGIQVPSWFQNTTGCVL